MESTGRKRAGGRELLLLLLFLLPCPLPAVAEEAVRPVVHPDVPVTRLAPATIRALFNMRLLTWPDGTPVRVFVLEDGHPLHRRFCKEYLGVFPHQLRYSWNRRVYSGIGQSPRQVRDLDEMYRKIAETPGAIGYLPVERIDDRVRAIEVE